MNRIYIGFDSSQEIAYDVLVWSIRKASRKGLDIRPLRLHELEQVYGFSRPPDPVQSTEFTYSRFLVPWLCDYEGIAVFMDSDMVALADVGELFELDMRSYALRVVKHDYRPKEKVKMGGKVQTSYARKNWSSLMIMNCAELRCWTKEDVETRSGAWLHRFTPIPDAKIGEIPFEWNALDHYDEHTKLTHLTSGGPWLKGCENHPCAKLWLEFKAMMEAYGT